MAERFFENPPEFEDLVVTVLMRNFIHEEEYKEALEAAKDEPKKGEFSGQFLYCSLKPFLNAWGCRASEETIKNLKEVLDENTETIIELRKKSFREVAEDEEAQNKLCNLIKDLNDAKRVGLTIATKTLHIIMPNVVVMLDDTIKKVFIAEENCVDKEICFEFQKKMWEWAAKLNEDKDETKKEQTTWQKLEKVLREFKLSYWTELKLLDAYNWLRITKEIDFDEVKKLIREHLCNSKAKSA